MNGLEGHAVVVTGAGAGIGAAYARAIAAAGGAVIVNDIDPRMAEEVAARIRASGGTATAFAGDVADAQQATALIAACIDAFGKITGLVNNAAILRAAPLESADLADLRAMLEVNVVGVFNCARAAVGPMLAQGYGSIVNITSGAHAGQPALGGYGASKGAVASFTYGWAGELDGRGVRVNAVSPIGATAMSSQPNLPPPEANAPAVLYLLSDRSRHVTGQVLRINGPKLCLMSHPAMRQPILESGCWTLDSVAQAFETTLNGLLMPTNVASYAIAAVDPAYVSRPTA